MADPDFTIDVTQLSGADLQQLLTTDAQTLFKPGKEFHLYLGKPLSEATDKLTAALTISAPGSWKTSTGVGFTLKASATCKITVASKSTCFKLAKAIDSSDTQEIYGNTPAGSVYVNIDLDFDIQGNLSASGSAGLVGICGKTSGTGAATFSYCHPVPSGTETGAAIRAAFQALKFPFQPDSLSGMALGAISSVKFDGSFSLELDLTYGLGKYTVAAPGISAIRQSLTIGATRFNAPDVSLSAGVKAAFTYKHTEHFEAIVSRASATQGTLLLSRSTANETDESLGITVGVSLVDPPSASTDTAQLASAINGVTGSGGEKAAGAATALQSSAVANSTSWLGSSGISVGTIGLTATLAQQKSRALLYEFSADLTNPAIAGQSWSAFAKGDLQSAMRIGGLTLLPSSGVANCMQRSSAIKLQFFNLFAVTDTDTYFQKTYVSVAPDGSLRYSFDIGKEGDVQIKKAMQKTRLHFIASGADTSGDVGAVEIDLHVEMTEPAQPRVCGLIVDSLATVATAKEEAALRQFLHDTPKGTLCVQYDYAPSAYAKMQPEDVLNWQAFQSSAIRVLGLGFLSGLTYDDWSLFNRICIDGIDPNTGQPRRSAPDRRQSGAPASVPPSFYTERNVGSQAVAVQYFFLSSAQFMNLCADLLTLANTELANTSQTWDELIANVSQLVQQDVNTDWSVPAANALLSLCIGPVETSNLQQQKDKATYTVKLS
jgi:hypothetical protein